MTRESVEYRLKFGKIFQEQVLPVLKEMEPERQSAQNKALLYVVLTIIMVFCIILPVFFVFLFPWIYGVFYVFISNQDLSTRIWVGFLSTFAIACVPRAIKASWSLIFMQYNIHRNNLETSLKTKVMNKLLSAFGDFKWSNAESIDEGVLETSKLFPKYKKAFCDDVFVGSYKGTQMCIAETTLIGIMNNDISENEVEISCKQLKLSKHAYIKTQYKYFGSAFYKMPFCGVIICAGIPRNFKGHTIVIPKGSKSYSGYQKIELEDIDFSKQFDVYSTDQVEARYLLTTAFMERYKNVQKAFSGSSISCSFINKSFLIAIPTKKDLFSLGRLDIPLTELSQYNTMLNDFISVFELLEELKLYQDTGL